MSANAKRARSPRSQVVPRWLRLIPPQSRAKHVRVTAAALSASRDRPAAVVDTPSALINNRWRMIGLLRGHLAEKRPNQILVDVGGVGYQVSIPLSTFYALGELRDDVTLLIHTHLREDSIALYGFLTAREKQLFELLLSASGVGPGLALKILSGMSVDELVPAVRSGDVPRLTRIPGVGRKTAERMIVELRDKLAAMEPAAPEQVAPAGRSQLEADVISALLNLGYDRRAAEQAVEESANGEANRNFEALLRAALQQLSQPAQKGARRSA
jgi:holliday junction DNA helicase RuvA